MAWHCSTPNRRRWKVAVAAHIYKVAGQTLASRPKPLDRAAVERHIETLCSTQCLVTEQTTARTVIGVPTRDPY